MEILELVNSVTPLGAVVLLAYVIYLLVKTKRDVDQKVVTITDNHLHDLPEIADTLRRIEVKLGEEFAWIKARLNHADR